MLLKECWQVCAGDYAVFIIIASLCGGLFGFLSGFLYGKSYGTKKMWKHIEEDALYRYNNPECERGHTMKF
jgi:hypothetical protein